MFSSLNELLKLPDKPRLDSVELDKAKASMKDLRSRGFTNKEVSLLTRGRWSENTVKKYTRGVKVQSTVEKDKVMEMITDLAIAGKSIQDMEEYQQFNRFLETQDITIESLTKYYYDSISKKIDLPVFIKLYDELVSSERSLEQINSDLNREEKLVSQDLSIENMSLIHQTATMYGGFEKTLSALNQYNDIIQINHLYMQAQANFNQKMQRNQELVNQNAQLETQNKAFGAYATTAQGLLAYGYDLASLGALKKLAEKFGGPVSLFDAIG